MSTSWFGQALRFGLVGAIGFATDGGILWVLVAGGVDPYLARAFSFPVAVIVTWYLNRIWTFARARKAHPVKQFRSYFLVQIGGVLANLIAYTGVIEMLGKSALFAMAAFTAGSFLGMFVNFAGARAFVFERPDEKIG